MERGRPTEAQRQHLQKIAPLGGKATAEKHGPTHHKEAGKRGFEKTCTLYFQGDKAKMMTYLARRSMEANDPAPFNGAHQFTLRFPEDMNPFNK